MRLDLQIGDEGGIDVDEDVGPDFTNVVDLVELGDIGKGQGVDFGVGGVRVGTDALASDVGAHGEVLHGGTLLLEPEGHSVRPSLTHTSGLGRGETGTRASTSKAVGNTVSHLMTDDIVLHVAVTVGGAL